MLLSKGFLTLKALSFGKYSYFIFGNPQRDPGDRLNFLAQKKQKTKNKKQKTKNKKQKTKKQKTNGQNNQGNPGVASDTRG